MFDSEKLSQMFLVLWAGFEPLVRLLYICAFLSVSRVTVGLQIGAVTMDRSADGSPELLVSQPGRTYVTLLPRSATRPDSTPATEGSVC